MIALLENKEMARNALPSSTLSAVSSFQCQQNPPTEVPSTTPSRAAQAKQATCPDCKEGARGWNTEHHQVGLCCYRARRRRKRPQHQTPPPPSPANLPDRPWNQSRYPKLQYFNPTDPADDVSVNAPKPCMVPSAYAHVRSCRHWRPGRLTVWSLA